MISHLMHSWAIPSNQLDQGMPATQTWPVQEGPISQPHTWTGVITGHQPVSHSEIPAAIVLNGGTGQWIVPGKKVGIPEATDPRWTNHGVRLKLSTHCHPVFRQDNHDAPPHVASISNDTSKPVEVLLDSGATDLVTNNQTSFPWRSLGRLSSPPPMADSMWKTYSSALRSVAPSSQ